ncbi:hypothetical protein [Pseudomonas sp. 18173]|uniref:hypothetical protein n=1 Tax=Pseudomonas sp. 18173 TaxID=3390055 RepID=UPI003D1A85BA
MIDSQTMKKGSWLVFCSVTFLSALGPSNIEYYWWGYLFFCALFFSWTLYLIYVCESYVVYLVTVLTATIGIFSFLASGLAYLSASNVLGETSVLAIAVGLSPAILVFAVFAIVYFSKPSFFPFECTNNKIAVRARKQSKQKYNIGFIAGVTTLIGGVFLKSVDALTIDVVAVSICTGCSVAILILLRHTVRGLRTLRIQERNMDVPFTFMEIDEIREARHRWWLGRFFKWILSLRESHD